MVDLLLHQYWIYVHSPVKLKEHEIKCLKLQGGEGCTDNSFVLRAEDKLLLLIPQMEDKGTRASPQ